MVKLDKKKVISIKTENVKGYAIVSCILTFAMLILGIVLREAGYITSHCWVILIAAIYNLINLLFLSKNYYTIKMGTPEYLYDGTPNSKIVIEWKIFLLIVIPGFAVYLWMLVFCYGINCIDDEFAYRGCATMTNISLAGMALWIGLWNYFLAHFKYDDVTEGKDLLLNILCAACSLVIALLIAVYGNWCLAVSTQHKTIVLDKTLPSDAFDGYKVLTDWDSDPLYVNKNEFNRIDIGDTVIVEERKGLLGEDVFYIKH